MSDELQNCPFCGGHAVCVELFEKPLPRFGCPACGIFKLSSVAWNRRAQPAEPQLDPITLRKMSKLITKGYAQVGVIMGKEGERAYVDMGKVTWTQPAEEVRRDALKEADALTVRIEAFYDGADMFGWARVREKVRAALTTKDTP